MDEKGLRALFERVLPAQSWEMPVERELSAKLGPPCCNFDFRSIEQNPSTALGIIPKKYHFFSASLRQPAPAVIIHKKWISWRKEYMVEVNFLCGQHAGEEYRAEERENIRLPKHEIYYFYSCKFSFYLCVWYFERSNSSNGLYLWIKCSSCLCFQSMQMCILRKC